MIGIIPNFDYFDYYDFNFVLIILLILIFIVMIISDGDGLISPEDLFLAEARILQRSPQFLRAIFRVYTEAVWYPGRQLNHISIQRAAVKATQRQSG